MAEQPPNDDEEVYDISGVAAEVPAEWRAGAAYELEAPVRCPHCRDAIRTVRVVRMQRGHVAFTSTLPRSGRAFVCPLCERLLSLELSGLI
jgi:hypothetical protein